MIFVENEHHLKHNSKQPEGCFSFKEQNIMKPNPYPDRGYYHNFRRQILCTFSQIADIILVAVNIFSAAARIGTSPVAPHST